MNHLRNHIAATAVRPGMGTAIRPWAKRNNPVAGRNVALTRRYEIEWLTPGMEIQNRTTIGPAIPMFEQAFSAFSRGSLVQTMDGAVAVEDLRPGMMIDVVGGEPAPLMWIGAMTLLPASSHINIPPSHLYRVAEGSFGLSAGMPDLLLGSGARVMRNGRSIDPMARLADIGDLCDGFAVVEVTPRSPMRVFHLGLASHSLFTVNDVVVESYHPGHNPHMRLSAEMFDVFLSVFPHIRKIGDFGPLNHLRSEAS